MEPEDRAPDAGRAAGLFGTIGLRYEFGSSRSEGLRNPLFESLAAVEAHGSIAAAARALDVSYRYLWGYLKAQEAALSQALVHWDKGRAARLTEFAGRLLWAERLSRARMAGEIANLAADLGRELSRTCDPGRPVARCTGEHDGALALLHRHCTAGPGPMLDLHFEPALEALSARRRQGCALVAIHLPVARPDLAGRGSGLHRAYGPLLSLRQDRLVRVGERVQGLIVTRADQSQARALDDLSRLRFACHPPGTATRALFDQLVASVATDAPPRPAQTEPTHLAVAASVASGQVQAGFGLEWAAAEFGLSFVPIVTEQSFLAGDRSAFDSAGGSALLDVLQSAAWRQALTRLPGYDGRGAGETLSPRRALPWYR